MGWFRQVFGLPGNPVSALVCFHLTVVPALRKLSGWAQPHLRSVGALICDWLVAGKPPAAPRTQADFRGSSGRRVSVRLETPLKTDAERPEYHRATLSWAPEGHLQAASTGGGLSSRLLSTRYDARQSRSSERRFFVR